jgi:hypothetical protein
MKLVSKIVVRPDAPLHVYTNLSFTRLRALEAGAAADDHEVFGPKQPAELELEFQGFAAHIALMLDLVENPLLKGHHSYGCNQIAVTLQREIGDTAPTLEEIGLAHRKEYLTALHVLVNRLTAYFRYQLGNPFLRRLNAGHITSWDWLTDRGELIHSESRGHIMARFPGAPDAPNSLGSQSLKRSHLPRLRDALTTPIDLSVAYELRLQAQEAIFEGKGFLSVLLLAVSSEVSIKTAFFRRDSIASDAFDYLEEKRQVEVSPIELIHKVAKRAFGQSFADYDRQAFDSIDNLFRCRNKIAHRAKATYRDKHEVLTSPTGDSLIEWWSAVTKLQAWLELNCGSLPAVPSSEVDQVFAVDAWRDIPTELTGHASTLAR